VHVKHWCWNFVYVIILGTLTKLWKATISFISFEKV